MKRAASKTTAIVFALLLIVSPIAGIAPITTTATAQTGAPDGFVGVPDTNVQEDLPVGTNVSLTEHDLEGSVMASDHASSLEVIVTTPKRAEGYVNSSSVSGGAGGVALVFQDDVEHSGRRIAVPADAIRETVGYLPEVVHGVHESGDGWTSEVEARNGLLIFEVPRFSSNTVTFEGEVQVSGDPAQNGSQYSYDVGDTASVDDFLINVTGSTASHWGNETATAIGDGEAWDLSIAGNTDPTGPSTSGEPVVQFTGRTTTFPESASATGAADGSTASFEVNGDESPQGQSVTFTGYSSSTTQAVSRSGISSGGTYDYSIGGNVPATNATVTFTGQETSTSGSGSGTGSGSVSVGGNVDPNGESVTFTGRESTNTVSETQTALTPGSSMSISPRGNLDPDGPSSNGEPTLSITGHASKASWTTGPAADGSTTTYNNKKGIEIVPNNDGSQVEIEIYDGGGATEAYLYDSNMNLLGSSSISNGKATINADVSAGSSYYALVDDNGNPFEGHYYQSGGTSSGASLDIAGGADDNGAYGTRYHIKNARLGYLPSGVSADSDNGVSVSYGDFKSGETKTKEFDISEGATSVSVSGTSGNFDLTLDYTEVTGSENPAIDTDGDGKAEASHTGVLANGETSTVSASDLSVGSNSISTSTAAGPQPDWTLEWTEITATEDPVNDLNNDGTTDVSYQGILRSGETYTAEVSDLATGSHTGSVTLAAGQTDVSLSYDETTATKDPAVDVDGDGQPDAQYSGVLYQDETATVSLSDLTTGSQSVEVITGGSQVDWQIDYDRVEHTENPGLDMDGDGSPEVLHSGVLAPGETVTKEVPSLRDTTNAVYVETASSTTTDATLRLEERTETVAPEVVVNGEATGGSAVGRLEEGETRTLQTDTSWIQEGVNTITVHVGDGSLSGDAPAPEVNLDYRHSAQVQVDTTYTAGGWQESYNVSHTFAGDRQNAQLRIPFSSRIYEIENVEQSVNGGSWESIPSEEWTLENGTELVVQLDDGDGSPGVEGGDTIAVRTTGQKVKVQNGEISVTDPTDPSDSSLDAGITVESRSPGFVIAVGGTESGDRVHYTHSESWENPDETAVIGAHGQVIDLPNAPAGGSARVTTIPLEPIVSEGDVGIHVADPDQPSLEIGPGTSGSGTDVTYRWYLVQSGEKYGLFSLPRERYLEKADAGTEYVELADDDSEEALVIRQPDGSAGGSGGSGGSGGFVGSDGSWSDPTDGIQLQEIGVVVAWVVFALLLIAATGRSRLSGRRRWAVVGVVSGGTGLLSLELIRPGSISGAINSGLAEIIPLAGLAVIGYAGFSLWQWWRARREEARTPETEVTIDAGSD